MRRELQMILWLGDEGQLGTFMQGKTYDGSRLAKAWQPALAGAPQDSRLDYFYGCSVSDSDSRK